MRRWKRSWLHALLSLLVGASLLGAGSMASAQAEPASSGPPLAIPPAGVVHPSVRLAAPLPGGEATSPLRIVGEARGTWYFEASFAIRLYGPDGRELGVAVAQAQGPWMTEAFVPFEAELTFNAPPNACLTLVLEKANPSDLPEHDDEVRIGLRCVLEK